MSKISTYRIADLLCGAFEGGSGYWACIADMDKPSKLATPWNDEYTPSYIAYPLSEGGAVIIQDDQGDIHKLNLETIHRGQRLLENNPKYTSRLLDVIKENDDADTADVFLQLCLFGEVIYG